MYIPRVSAFGCFDDCFNFLGGYFTANGKIIYKDFFFNHQPVPALISYVIQTATHPINIFELILRHRQFLLLFGFLFNILFLIRFKYLALPFIVIFELSKFYIFGDRFLAEGLIVYPLVYLLGIVLLRLFKRKPYAIDYLLCAVYGWFVIFSREPYVPLALFLLILIFWGKFSQIKKISITLFGFLTFLLLFYIGDIKEYFFNVVTFNLEAVLPSDIAVKMWGPKPFHIFFYPIYIFFYGEWTILKKLLFGIDLVFLAYLILLIKKHIYKIAFFIILILGLSNFRVILPGDLFYGSFHIIVWYGLFIFTTSFLIFKYSGTFTVKLISLFLISIFLVLFLSSRTYFPREKVDPHGEFLTNFGHILQDGEAIKSLSNENDTLFLERSDDLIYWQAGLKSSYKYSWFTSQMNFFPKYNNERINMFKINPPVFYREFGVCPKKSVSSDQTLPEFVKGKYIRLYTDEKESCVFVRKDKLKLITPEQWEKAKELKYNQKPGKL